MTVQQKILVPTY